MKHILLFENFEDDIDPLTRDIFGLEDEFVIEYTEPTPYGDKRTEYCKIKGPSENLYPAEELVDEIREEVEELERNWADEGRYVDEMMLDDLFYDNDYFKKLDSIGYSVYYFHGPNKGYVKHEIDEDPIKEEHTNDIDSLTREIFGLTHTIDVYDLFGSTGIVVSGPSEESVNAHKIVREIEGEIHRRLPNPRSAPRYMWIETVNGIMQTKKSELSKIGYKIDTWYNGAESPEHSR